MPALDFPGKEIIYAHHLTVPYCPLETDKKKSIGDGDLDGNLIINADNLYALKALLPRYGGRVHCIYIDPPYNTGNGEWIYNDRVDSPTMRRWLKDKKAVDGEDQERHDKWCCMMWPRLFLLRELLAENGVIFVSIDDNEQASLKLLMDEIFGAENFVATVPSITNLKGNYKYGFRGTHEYFLVFTKSKKTGRFFEFDINDEEMLLEWKEDEHGLYKKGAELKATGEAATRESRPNLFFPIYVSKDLKTIGVTKREADDVEVLPISKNGKEHRWVWKREKISEEPHNLMAVKRGGSGNIVIHKKQRPSLGDLPTKKPKSHFYKPEYSSGNATNELKKIFGSDRIFPNPKTTAFIKDIVRIGCPPDALILDSFAGSGATAQAVLELNKQDGGNRKFILVECEDYADKVTAERVRRVIKGIPAATKDENLKNGLGGEFTFCKLGDELTEDGILSGKKLPSFDVLARHLFHCAAGKSLPNRKIGDGKFPWFVGDYENYRLYLIYKPDRKWLRSEEAALSRPVLNQILKHKPPQVRAVVYAASKFLKQKELRKSEALWAPLPFALYGSPTPGPAKTPLENQK